MLFLLLQANEAGSGSPILTPFMSCAFSTAHVLRCQLSSLFRGMVVLSSRA